MLVQAVPPTSVQPALPPPPSNAATRDPTTVQSIIGPNMILTVFIPLYVATALQTTNFELGLIIATAVAGVHVALGVVFFIMSWRRVFPYILEAIMVIMYPVLMAIVLADDDLFASVLRNYNFIVHSVLAGTGIISMVVTYPLGVQHVQEMVPWVFAGHEQVLGCGYLTTGFMVICHVASCLFYLIPVAEDVEDEETNALNIIFRIVVPIVLTFIGSLFTRFYPSFKLSGLQTTQVYSWYAKSSGVTYPDAAMMLRRPRVIDPAMIGRQDVYKMDVMDGYMRYQNPLGNAYGDPNAVSFDAYGNPIDGQYNNGMVPGQYVNQMPGQRAFVQPGSDFGLYNQFQNGNGFGLYGDVQKQNNGNGLMSQQPMPGDGDVWDKPGAATGGVALSDYPAGNLDPPGGDPMDQDPVLPGSGMAVLPGSGMAAMGARQRMGPEPAGPYAAGSPWQAGAAQQQVGLAQQRMGQAQEHLDQAQMYMGGQAPWQRLGPMQYGPNGQVIPVQQRQAGMVQAGNVRMSQVGQNGMVQAGNNMMNQAGNNRLSQMGQNGMVQAGNNMMNQAGNNRLSQMVQNGMVQAGNNVMRQRGQNAMGQAGNNMINQAGNNMMNQAGNNIMNQMGQNARGQAGNNMINQPGSNMMNQMGQAAMVQAGNNMMNQAGNNMMNQVGQAAMVQAGNNMINQAGNNMMNQMGQAAMVQAGNNIMNQAGNNVTNQMGQIAMSQAGQQAIRQGSQMVPQRGQAVYNQLGQAGIRAGQQSIQQGGMNSQVSGQLGNQVGSTMMNQAGQQVNQAVNQAAMQVGQQAVQGAVAGQVGQQAATEAARAGFKWNPFKRS